MPKFDLSSLDTPNDALRAWLLAQCSDVLHLSESEMDPDKSLADLGLDSQTSSQLAARLSDGLSLEVLT